MNNILTNSILDPLVGQPWTGPSLNFLQGANKSMFLGVASSFVGDGFSSAVPYVLQGVRPTGTNQYTSGWMFYGDEMYFCLGKSSITLTAQTVATLVDNPDTGGADPLTFTDGIQRNVHRNRFIILNDLPGGSGLFDFSAATYVIINKVDGIINDNAAQTYSTNTYTDHSGISYTTPNDGVTRTMDIQVSLNCKNLGFTGGLGQYSGGEFRLIIGSTPTGYTQTTYLQPNTGVDNVQIMSAVTLLVRVSVPPNTAIKLQCRMESGSAAGIIALNATMKYKQI